MIADELSCNPTPHFRLPNSGAAGISCEDEKMGARRLCMFSFFTQAWYWFSSKFQSIVWQPMLVMSEKYFPVTRELKNCGTWSENPGWVSIDFSCFRRYSCNPEFRLSSTGD